MAKRDKKPAAKPEDRLEAWEETLRSLEKRSGTDLSFLDQLEDEPVKDEILRLPYELPDSYES